VRLLAVDGEALGHGEHERGEECCAIGLKEPIKRPAEPIITQVPELGILETVHRRRKAVHRLDLAVDGFPLDHDRAQQHAERCRVRHGAAAIGGRDIAIEELDDPEPVDEVIDEG